MIEVVVEDATDSEPEEVTDVLRQMHVGLSNIAGTTKAPRELSVETNLDLRCRVRWIRLEQHKTSFIYLLMSMTLVRSSRKIEKQACHLPEEKFRCICMVPLRYDGYRLANNMSSPQY